MNCRQILSLLSYMERTREPREKMQSVEYREKLVWGRWGNNHWGQTCGCFWNSCVWISPAGIFYWPSSEGLKGHLVTAEPRRAQKSKFFTIQVIQSKVLFANFKTKHNKQHHVVETVLYESVSLSWLPSGPVARVRRKALASVARAFSGRRAKE